MWRFLKLPTLVFALALLIAGGVAVFNPGWLKIESIDLQMQADSQEPLLFERIKTALMPQMNQLTGQFFWDVPLSRIHTVTVNDKRVKNLAIYREFPNRIRVEITPHTPVMAYLSSDNRFYPVAKDATLLPPLNMGEFPDLPILRGEDLKDDPPLRMSAIELFEMIPQDGTLRRSALSEIVYTKKDGFKIFLSDTSGEIKFGDADFGPKISRVQKVLSYLESQNVKGRVIDARFSKKVVVRVRNSP